MSAAGGGGGGQPLKILFQILGINEAKAALTSLIPEVSKIGTAADAAGKKVGVIADSVKKTGSAGSGLKPISDNLTKIDSSATKAAGSTTKVQQSMDKTKTSVAGFTSASNQSSASVTKLATGHDQLSTSGAKVATSQDRVSKSTTDVKSSADQASGSVSKVAKSQDDLSSSSGKTSGSLDKQKGSLKGVGDESKSAEGGLVKVKGATDQVGGSSQQASTKQGTLRSSFTSTMGAAASLGGGITSLWQTYDSLGDAQLRVDKATNTLHTTQTKIQSLQIQLNKLTADGKEGTDQYRLVEEKLNIAQDKLVAGQGTLQNAQEDLNITQAEFYQRIIPETITVLGSMATLLSNSSGLLGKFKDGLSNLSIESLKTSKVLSLISLTNPFFIALTVGAGIVAAFVTNLFGFRDAINGVGVAIGNALGPLKPFLTMIGQLGEGLVNALGMGGDATKQYAADTTDSMGTATDAVGGHQTAVVSAFEQQHNALVKANLIAAGYTTDFVKNMGTAGGAMPGLTKSVSTATETSIQKMDALIKKSKETSDAMGVAFSKTVDLGGGAKITNLSEKAPPTSTVAKDIGGKYGGGKDLSVPWQKLTNVLTQFDPIAQKTSFSLASLQAEGQKAGLTAAQVDKVHNYLTKTLGMEAVVGVKAAASSSALADAVARNRDVLLDHNEAQKAGLEWHMNTIEGLGEEASATDLATGSTEGMAAALGESSSGLQTAAGGTTKLVGSQKILSELIGTSATDLAGYNEMLHSEAMMHEVATAGTERQKAAMAKSAVELVNNTAASAEYTRQLYTQSGRSIEVAKGILAQNDAFNQAKATMLQNAGALVVLSDATKMADAKNVAFVDGILTTVIAIKKQQIATEGVKGDIVALIAEQIRGEAQTTAYNKGFYEQEKQFQLDKIAIFETTGKLEAMHLEYERGEAQTLAYNKGLVAQRTAFEESKTKANELQATIAALNEEGRSGEAQTVAFNNAFFEQELAFNKSKVSADALRATVAAMRKEYSVASVIAFTAAFEDQNKKFEQDKLAVDALGGTILSLKAKFETGEADILNFNKGMREQEIAFLNSKAAIEQEEGAIASMISHLNDGTSQTVAFNKGLYDQRKATLEAYDGVSTLIGGVREYHTAVSSGLPQIVAFETAFQNQKKALDEMNVSTAGTLATLAGLRQQLSDLYGVTTRFNSGFATGAKSIANWASGIATARGEASGAQSEFDNLAGTFGETLPEGFNASLDAQKTFVEAMQGVPDVVQGIADQMASKGEAMASSLAEAFKKGQEGVDEAFDGLGEKVGFTIDQEIRDGLNASMVAATLKGQLEEGFTLLHNIDFARNPGAFAKVAAGITGDIADAIAKDPTLATMGQPILDAIAKLRMNPNDAQLWKQLEQLISNFKSQAGGAAVVQNSLTTAMKNPEGINGMIANLGTGEQALANYNKAIAASQKTVMGYQQILGHMWDNALGPKGETGMGQAGEALKGVPNISGQDLLNKKPTGGGTDPFAAQMQLADAFKAKLTEIQGLAQTTATAITTAFTTMGTTFGTTVTQMGAAAGAGATIIGGALAAGFQTAGTYITTLGTSFSTQVNAMAAAAGAGAVLIGGSLAKGFEVAGTYVTTLTTSVGSQFTAMGSAAAATAIIIGASLGKGFQEAEKYANTSMQSILRMSTLSLAKIGPAAVTAGAAIGAGIRKGEPIANTSLQAILRMATLSFGKIGPAASAAGVAIGKGIQAGERAANTAFSSMASKASSTFNSIVSSANRATSSVKQLANAINSLKNKTVTITTVYVTRRVTAAKGFGPTVVSNATNMTFGESGPELVSVIPMTQPNSGISTHGMGLPSSITNSVSSSSSQYSRTGINNMFGGGSQVNNNSNINSSTSASQQNSTINRFNESVARISNTFDKQESRMVSSNIQNVSSVRNGGAATNYGGGVSNYNTTNVPNISTVRNGNVYNSGGGGGGSVEGVVAMVKDIITSAFAQTTINVTSQAIIDGDKTYEAQKKQFGLRNGAILK